MRHTTRGPVAALALVAAFGVMPLPLAGQEGPALEVRGLLRTGLRVEPDASDRESGFEVFDARLGAEGRVGVLFDYRVLGAWEGTERRFELLDAEVGLPLAPEARLAIGQFKAPFGQEFLRRKGDIAFVDRSQASDALVPGRQVGARLDGEGLEGRLTWAAGLFNGNGRRLENDDGRFLYAARAQFNSVGPIEFYRELVVQVGANLAFSRDSAAPLGPGVAEPPPPSPVDGFPPPVEIDAEAFRGERLLWGVDARASWRGFSAEGEYLRGEFEPAEAPGERLTAEGGYLQGSYGAMGGLLEGVARWDAFRPAAGARRDFLLLGLNLYPGFYAKVGLQYAVSLRSGQPPGARIAGGQFAFLTQVSF